MQTVTGIVATTHVDLHNEALALSALEGIVDQINSTYMPVGIEHDPRIPPVGRIKSAAIQELDDGEHGAAVEIELFEPDDLLTYADESRKAVLPFHNSGVTTIIQDRTFASAEDQKLIAELREALNADCELQAKKSLEPISVLTIALTVLGTNVLGGFLQKIGQDAWDVTKIRLKKLFERKRNSPAQLLNIAVTVQLQGQSRIVEIIISDPTPTDIDGLRPQVVGEAVRMTESEVVKIPGLVRFVYLYSAKSGLRLQFAVASNGRPLLFAASFPAIPEGYRGLSLSGPQGEPESDSH